MSELEIEAKEAFKCQRYADSRELFENAMNSDIENNKWKSNILLNQVSCLLKEDKNKEALELITRATKIDSKNSKFFYIKGKLEKELEDWESAHDSMIKAKNLDPSLPINDELKEIGEKLNESNTKDYHAVLGVDKNASADEIKKAYKKLALEWHPDKHAGNEEAQVRANKKFKIISHAYKELSGGKKKMDFHSKDSDEKRGKPSQPQKPKDQSSGSSGHHYRRTFVKTEPQERIFSEEVNTNTLWGGIDSHCKFMNQFHKCRPEDMRKTSFFAGFEIRTPRMSYFTPPKPINQSSRKERTDFTDPKTEG